MLCRVAEDLFWVARYVERALGVVRQIEVTWHLELDAGDDESFWQPLLDSALAHGTARDRRQSEAAEMRHHLAFDELNPSSVVSCIRHARAAARGVRETISSEMWEQLNTLYLLLVQQRPESGADEEQTVFFRRVREALQFFQGLVDATLSREEPWYFLTLGTSLERASTVARVVTMHAQVLTPHPELYDDLAVRWLSVLRSCGSAEAYANYYSMRVDPVRVVEFLLLNRTFPQSLRFSVETARRALDAIDAPFARGPSSGNQAVRALGLLSARIEHAAVDDILEEGLERYVADLQRWIALVADHVTHIYLRHEPRPGRLVTVARAAMMSAAQQQQQQQQQ